MPDLLKEFPSNINTVSENEPNGFNNEVTILIGATPYRIWNDLEISLSFDQVADTFSLTTPFDPGKRYQKDTFEKFKYTESAIYVGGGKELTGNIINYKTNTTGSSRLLTMDGYSKPGILNDCPPPASSWPIGINGLNLKEIAEKFAGDYDIGIDFEGDPGAKFSKRDKFEPDPETAVIDFLIDLAQQRGFVISSTVKGELAFKKTPSGFVSAYLIEGENPYLKSSAEYNGQDLFSDITLIKSQTGFGAGQKTTVQDKVLTGNGVFRSTVARAEDTEMGNLKKAATSRLGRMIADATAISVTQTGWRRYDNGDLWRAGDLLNYTAPGDMVYTKTEFLVREVKLKRKNNEMTASLELVLPESYE